MRLLALLLVVLPLAGGALLTACPQTPPQPPPVPDASDAAPVFVDGAPPPTACALACADMVQVGCVQLPSCPVVLANAEHMRLIPNPLNGRMPLTCQDLVGVKTADDVKARGWSCGP